MQRIHVTIRPLNREDSVLYFPPEAFGPFRVLHQIGAGTLGPVFRAYEPAGQRRDRLVAVKVFRLDLTPEQTAALVAELEKLVDATIHHPNIAAPIAAGLEHGAAYLAQEYAIGDSLDIVLRERGTMPVSDVAALIELLGGAIDHAAKRGVSHGMLHPRDVILAPDAARITGFGIAAALSKVGAKLPTRPLYAGPDASDMHSLATVAFEAAFGSRVSAKHLIAAHDALRASDIVAGLKASAPNEGTTNDGTQAVVVPTLRSAPPVVPSDDFDLRLDHPVDLMGHADGDPPEPASSRWPIVAMFLVFAALTALSVGFFLKSPTPTPGAEKGPTVDETIVDLPNAPNAPNAPIAPNAPNASIAPRPSRPASGAVRPAQTGSVLIRSTPADADVLVNGKPRGQTPLALRDLALGSYTIRVARNGYAAEERTLQLTARRPARSTTINLRPIAARSAAAEKAGPGVPANAMGGASATVGGLNVQSRPAGARVFVNDRLAGSTPIAIPGLPAGDATVRIEKDGYVPWTAAVRVSAGEQTAVRASLEGK